MQPQRIPTPCIGLCSTTYGDSVCRGCKRFAHEIVDWNRYDEPQKAAVILRLEQLIGEVVDRYLLVTDVDTLESALQSAGFRYRRGASPQWWAYDLLRQTKGRIGQLSLCGLRKLPEADYLDNPKLWDAMAHEFLAISEGHYERFFRRPLAFDD